MYLQWLQMGLTIENMKRQFGCPIPAAFLELFRVFYEHSGHDLNETPNLFWKVTGMILDDESGRYSQTPPELFPIGCFGVDGVHYGYVIHAPELEMTDYPIGEFCPMDSDGAFLLGQNTLEAFENLISWKLRYLLRSAPEGEEYLALLEMSKIVNRLGIYPAAEKGGRQFGPDGNGFPVRPASIPEGWRYEVSADGIGVLAPREVFHPEPYIVRGRSFGSENWRSCSEEMLRQGYPATALLYLKDGFWFGDRGIPGIGTDELLERIREVYLQLNKPLLAEVVRRMLIDDFRD